MSRFIRGTHLQLQLPGPLYPVTSLNSFACANVLYHIPPIPPPRRQPTILPLRWLTRACFPAVAVLSLAPSQPVLVPERADVF